MVAQALYVMSLISSGCEGTTAGCNRRAGTQVNHQCESGLSVECIFAGEFQWSQGGRAFWLMGLNEGGSAQYLLDGEVIV